MVNSPRGGDLLLRPGGSPTREIAEPLVTFFLGSDTTLCPDICGFCFFSSGMLSASKRHCLLCQLGLVKAGVVSTCMEIYCRKPLYKTQSREISNFDSIDSG